MSDLANILIRGTAGIQVAVIFIMSIVYASTYFSYSTYVITWVPNSFTSMALYAAVVWEGLWRHESLGLSSVLRLVFFIFAAWFGFQNVIWMVEDSSNDLYNGTSPIWSYRNVSTGYYQTPGPQLRQTQLAFGILLLITTLVIFMCEVLNTLVTYACPGTCGADLDEAPVAPATQAYADQVQLFNGMTMTSCAACCRPCKRDALQRPTGTIEVARMIGGSLGVFFAILELCVTAMCINYATPTPPLPTLDCANAICFCCLLWSAYPLYSPREDALKTDPVYSLRIMQDSNQGEAITKWHAKLGAIVTWLMFPAGIVLSFLALADQATTVPAGSYYFGTVPLRSVWVIRQSTITIQASNQANLDFVVIGSQLCTLMAGGLSILCWICLTIQIVWANTAAPHRRIGDEGVELLGTTPSTAAAGIRSMWRSSGSTHTKDG